MDGQIVPAHALDFLEGLFDPKQRLAAIFTFVDDLSGLVYDTAATAANFLELKPKVAALLIAKAATVTAASPTNPFSSRPL